MARGAPDWYKYSGQSQYAAMAGLAELAVRLGALSDFDRRGDIIWFDSFEAGKNQWNDIGENINRDWSLCADYAAHGGFSGAMTLPGSTPSWMTVYKTIPITPASRIGFAFRWAAWVEAQYHKIYVKTDTAAGNNWFAVRYDPDPDNDNPLAYLDPDNNWTQFSSGIEYPTSSHTFNFWKLVVDPALEQYVRLIFNGDEYDLSGLEPYVWTGSPDQRVRCDYRIDGYDESTQTGYIDAAVFTIFEPA